MKKILFICQKIGFKTSESAHCGVGILADLTSSIVQKSTKHNFIPLFVDSQNELDTLIEYHDPDVIIYSYHTGTTKWIDDDALRIKWWRIKHIMIHYDIHQSVADSFCPSLFNGFKYIITDDVTVTSNKNVFVVPRSLPTDEAYKNTVPNDPPIIGYQGFALPHKGINNIAHTVQDEFDEATIRLHMPSSYFVDPNGHRTASQIDQINRIIHKPGIKVEIDTEFLSTEDIVGWLSQNDINCYFNDYLDGAGIASSPDYALSARKPIAITKSFQLRHLWNLEPSIIHSPTNTLAQIMSNGIEPLISVYEQNTHKALIAAYEHIVDSIT
jgi:hypothetical protein